MHHPFESWPAGGRRPAFVALVVLFVVTSVGLQMVGGPLRHDDAPLGVVSLQFAGSHEEVAEIVEPWIEEGVTHRAGFVLGLDHLYMITYGLLLAALAAALANRAAAAGRARTRAVAATAAWAVWLAAGFDAVETSSSLPYLADSTGGAPGVVVGFATAKWVLLAGVAVTLLAGAASLLRTGGATAAASVEKPAA